MWLPTHRPLAVAILAFAVILLGGCRAPMWVGGDPYEPQITRSAAERMADAAGMRDDQKRAFMELHAAYFDEHSQAAQRLRDYMASVSQLQGEPGDHHLGEKRMTAFTRYAAHVNTLADRFLGDAQLILDPAQLTNWPAAERSLRRSQFLSGDGSRGGMDLVSVVDSMDLPQTERRRLDPLLADYALAIDPPLMREAAFIRTNLKRNLEAADAEDQTAYDALYREWVGLQKDERSVNRRFVRAIADQLAESDRSRFHAATQRAMHQLFREDTEVDAALKKLSDARGVSAQERSSAEAIFADRARRRDALIDRIAAKIDQWEEHATLDELLAGTGAPEELATAGDELAKIDRDTLRKLSSQLSPEQMRAIGLAPIPRDLPDLDFDSDPNAR